MRKFKCVSFLASGMLVFGLTVSAEESADEAKPVQLDSLGGGIYRTGEGRMVQAEDLGEGDYMTQDGRIIQTESLGGGDYLTTDDRVLQVDDENEK